MLVLLIARVRHPGERGQPRLRRTAPPAVVAAFTLPLGVAGLSLALSVGGPVLAGLAVVLGFAGAVLNAWVLMVEIVR